MWVYILHALIIGPLLTYIAYVMLYGNQKVPRSLWNLLLLIGISATAYHAFKWAMYYKMTRNLA
jgi:hypothetical protein